MTDRKVSIAQDDSDEIPEIDGISFLSIITETSETPDPFSKPANEIRNLSGVNTTVKRRIAKMQRGVGGAETAQIQETSEFMNGYQSFDVVEAPYNLDYLGKLYEKSSPHHGAVDAKVANIVGLGYKFVETRKTKRDLEKISNNQAKSAKLRLKMDEHLDELMDGIEALNEDDTFTEILIKVWKDYETTGNGYLEIGRKKDGSIGYLGHIASKTMRIRKKRDGFVQITGHKAVFFANFGAGTDDEGNKQRIPNPIGNGTPNEVIHIKKYSPSSTYYGIPDIVAALTAIAGNEFASKFNLDYFENKAIPRHVIILKGAKLGKASENSLLQFFETGLKGQNHRSLFVPLPVSSKDNPVELTFESIGPDVQDSSFHNYRQSNLNDILMAHRVPVTKISVSENAALAVAKDADKTFKEQVCAPEQKIFEKKLNKIIKEVTDTFELKLEEMTLTDADTQSAIDERYVKNGIDVPNEIRARRGLPGIEGGNERVDLNAKSTPAAQAAADSATPRARDAARSAGRTDSAGAARNPKGEGRTTP